MSFARLPKFTRRARTAQHDHDSPSWITFDEAWIKLRNGPKLLRLLLIRREGTTDAVRLGRVRRIPTSSLEDLRCSRRREVEDKE